ncbi:hypothetical protein, partial [Staphylococcus pasteuri]|uniref:hypothetical protein n=1 Tax=Staphylococcus pasteuri TaxID=45972 RepID=UPI00164A0326
DSKEGMTYEAAKIVIIESVIEELKKNGKENEKIDYRGLLNEYLSEVWLLINIEAEKKDTKEAERLTKIAEE